MELLPINSSDGFLHLRDLPHNCIFNKIVTGCGGTTVVLRNSEDYVIAVPTTELIINKTGRTDAGLSLFKSEERSQPIFGLFGKFNSQVASDLNSYVESSGTKKIFCTYDKVPRLLDFITPHSFRLLIDEYHCLLKAYSYRQKAIDGVLDNFRKFKSFCFMSATPILPSFKYHQRLQTRRFHNFKRRDQKLWSLFLHQQCNRYCSNIEALPSYQWRGKNNMCWHSRKQRKVDGIWH